MTSPANIAHTGTWGAPHPGGPALDDMIPGLACGSTREMVLGVARRRRTCD